MPLKPNAESPKVAIILLLGYTVLADITDGKPIPIVPKDAASILCLGY